MYPSTVVVRSRYELVSFRLTQRLEGRVDARGRGGRASNSAKTVVGSGGVIDMATVWDHCIGRGERPRISRVVVGPLTNTVREGSPAPSLCRILLLFCLLVLIHRLESTVFH